MATAKKPEGPKAKLMKLSVATLRKKAKALNVSDYTKKTKEKLVVSIMLAEARKKGATARKRKPAAAKQSVMRFKRTGEQTGKSDLVRDVAIGPALAPGKRISRTGKVYYERRRNRSDVPPTMLGASPNAYVNEIAFRIITDYLAYEPNTEISEVFHEVIDGMIIYYSDAIKIMTDLQYFDWSDNDLGIEATNVSQVAYLALNELYGDVYEAIQEKLRKSR